MRWNAPRVHLIMPSGLRRSYNLPPKGALISRDIWIGAEPCEYNRVLTHIWIYPFANSDSLVGVSTEGRTHLLTFN